MKQVLASTLIASAAGKVMFSEKFEDLSKWTSSTWKSDTEMQEFEVAGLKNAADEKALATTKDARFYGTSAHFESPFSNKGKHLLVQYEATYDNDIECGGGYVKIGPKIAEAEKFGDPTEYAIMFGPDQCGSTKRTHLIFNYKGKNVLKKSDLPYKQDNQGVTSLYRLQVAPDNKVKVTINGDEIYSGSLEEDWDFLEAKEIEDPEDKKPEDWVDDAMIDDPESKKPEDWVEVKEIVDSSAKKPDDWDEEEDGAWEAPMIPNPEFKGEWSAKRITNPAYKGVWAPKKIANPKYEDDKELYLLNKKDLAFIGFDLWQVKSGSKFDNIIIATGDSEEEAKKEADDRVDDWKKLVDTEKAEKERTTTTTTTPAAAADEAEEDKDDDEDKKEEDL